jgi:gluconate 2-dehydrogenase gamma chain
MSAEETVRAFLARTIDRQEFIKRLRAIGVTAGAALSFAEALAAYQPALAALNDPANGPATTLTAEEFGLVESIAGRIVPTTDTPGAIEAGAATYIDRALGLPYRPLLPRYHAALAALQRYCRSALGAPFTALGAAQQDDVLANLAAGKIAAVEGGPAFFELVRRHVMEGMFCEPYYGGNRDMVGWKLVGFPGQRYGYSDPYINRVVDLPPVATSRPPQRGH